MRKQIQLKLLEEIRGIQQNLKPKTNRTLVNQIKTIEQTFKAEFSESRSKFYIEIFDGIILAMNQFSQETNEQSLNEMFNLSKELLTMICNELVNEKEIQRDLVFLPYKASMWDSLESIWEAAYEDKEHCNAYVIPIPYADRKPDGTVDKWHCETKLFPKYVPVLDYRKVNLEKLHPDIIFIHNPYDNYNSLTSVDSQYYTDQLIKCCNKLVYVPYFVAQEFKPGDIFKEENIAHFIVSNGVLNSDLTVVQSEDIRQVYINVLTRYTNQTDRKYWEKRIIGLGSPKFDKIISTTKGDIEIPKEWLKILEKTDGTLKKVVFYNTGVSLALKWKERLLNKMEEDFRIFKENQEEITLLWRPHPLMKATMAGMLPELQEQYETIVSRYKSEGWGIYDDSADANRAMALSDAYFGDGSSLLKLYAVTGKPIMNHNMLLNNKHTKLFKIHQAHYEEKEIYFTAFCDPNLYRINLSTNEIEFVTRILDEDEAINPTLRIVGYKNYFLFTKTLTNELIVMDRTNYKKEIYSIPSYNKVENLRNGASAAIELIVNDNLYIFGWDYKGLLKFNLNKREFKVIDEFMNDLQIRNVNESLCLRDGLLIEEKIYFPMVNTNAVLEFSTKDDSTKVHYVGDEKQQYLTGAYDGKNLWLIPRNVIIGDIVKWNISTNEVEQYKSPLSDRPNINKSTHERAVCVGNKVIVLSMFGLKTNLKIDIETNDIEVFDNLLDANFMFGFKHNCLNVEDDSINFTYELNLVKYKPLTDEIEKIELKLTEQVEENIRKYFEDKLKFMFKPFLNGKSMILNEQINFNLYHLLEYLKLQ